MRFATVALRFPGHPTVAATRSHRRFEQLGENREGASAPGKWVPLDLEWTWPGKPCRHKAG